jgi:ubiquinone/menaquinone biosynthesis C-methylase UbiE
MHAGMTFVDPVSIVRKLELAPGAVVVDFGCGAGYFTFEAAKAVGAEGKVYALDILPTALEAVASQAKVRGLSNIEGKRANLEKLGGSGLQGESVDWVILKDMLFQNQDKEVILQEISRILKKEGRLFLMEWMPEKKSMGPEEGIRISEVDVRLLLEKVGLHPENNIPAGDFHYALVARK